MPVVGIAQDQPAANILPAPSGPFPVGRIVYHWVDSSRAEFLDPSAARRREIMVDIWYPTTPIRGAAVATYLPNLTVIRSSLSDSAARQRFAPAYALLAANRLQTHATEGTPARCPPAGCPVLVFSHGGGVDRSLYTVQYEDLASNGYVVAVIAHTFDTHLAVFPDGHGVGAAVLQPTLANDPRKFGVQAADIRFVIGTLTRFQRERAGPFAGRLDLEHLGALGHSSGGVAAAVACQLDQRIKACLSQEGASPNSSVSQPFMYIARAPVPNAPPTGKRSEAYRVTIGVAGMSHMGFSDKDLIEAAGDSVKTASALLALQLTNAYTRAFFDKFLRGQTDTELDRPIRNDSTLVTVERYGTR